MTSGLKCGIIPDNRDLWGIPMTMHLLPAYFTSTRTAKTKAKTVKKLTAHDQWLMKRGLHPSQITAKKRSVGEYRADLPDYTVDRDSGQLSNSIGNGYAKGIMTNLHKESPEVQREIMLKAMRTTVAYNKGPTMYFSPESDTTNLGSSSRRG